MITTINEFRKLNENADAPKVQHTPAMDALAKKIVDAAKSHSAFSTDDVAGDDFYEDIAKMFKGEVFYTGGGILVTVIRVDGRTVISVTDDTVIIRQMVKPGEYSTEDIFYAEGNVTEDEIAVEVYHYFNDDSVTEGAKTTKDNMPEIREFVKNSYHLDFSKPLNDEGYVELANIFLELLSTSVPHIAKSKRDALGIISQ